MAGKKDKCVIFVASDLTDKQASDLVGSIAKEKNKIAPLSRATAGITTREGVGKLLQRGIKNNITKK